MLCLFKHSRSVCFCYWSFTWLYAFVQWLSFALAHIQEHLHVYMYPMKEHMGVGLLLDKALYTTLTVTVNVSFCLMPKQCSEVVLKECWFWERERERERGELCCLLTLGRQRSIKWSEVLKFLRSWKIDIELN
jgi:hypothetical protein